MHYPLSITHYTLHLGGVDNTANTATYFLYNLAIRPEIQKKLYQEIKEVVS